MLVASNDGTPFSQRGMTLLETLMVIAILAMISGLIVSSPALLSQSKRLKIVARSDFSDWYTHLSERALSSPSSQRICLIGQKMVLQHYGSSSGWQNTRVVYLPPRGVTLSWIHQDCGPVLNSSGDDFTSQITFGDAP
jgi:prepilin-type N-terminal cleavage/methylation domain-containing protein